MLVLTRRVGEEIVIADNIRVQVVAIKRDSIRVGITAPPSVPVFRLELLSKESHGVGDNGTKPGQAHQLATGQPGNSPRRGLAGEGEGAA